MYFYKNIFFSILFFFLTFSTSFGGSVSIGSEICDTGLPGCTTEISSDTGFFDFLGNIISEGIKYTAVIAVIAVMISGMMYLVSAGEEEKSKKAKKWILWSLVGVFLSVSAWTIINLVNSVNFD